MARNLILHIPVIHRGYLDFFKSYTFESINIIDMELFDELSDFKPAIVSLDPETAKKFLAQFGFTKVRVATKSSISSLRGKPLALVNDEVSRKLQEKYLRGEDIEWHNVFLYWDRKAVLSENPVNEEEVSDDPSDKEMMREAYRVAKNSSDWWRQVGAVLVKDGKIVFAEYNHGVPDDHTPYQIGGVRDFLNVGEKPELSPTIHAEQKIISQAARRGISSEGSSLYVTHFPCSVCAKLIAHSGISVCYFGEGSSNLDGEAVLRSASVKIRRVVQ